MPIFKSTSLESLQNNCTDFAYYANCYFGIDNVKPAEL